MVAAMAVTSAAMASTPKRGLVPPMGVTAHPVRVDDGPLDRGAIAAQVDGPSVRVPDGDEWLRQVGQHGHRAARRAAAGWRRGVDCGRCTYNFMVS